jgi:hypothetical protein
MNDVTRTLERKEHGVAVFCDLRKAFDSCDHGILLKRMEAMGIEGLELLWFKNYLTERGQFVQIKNFRSSVLSIKVGVPQGSILGPILFLIYINNLPIVTKLTTYLFADDTTLFFSHSNLETLIQIVNEELKKVVDFFRSSKIALHPSKTKFLFFSNILSAHNINVSLSLNFNNVNENDSEKILNISPVLDTDEIPAVRFLGVFFDANLNFKYHVNLLANKLSKSLYMLRTVKNILPSKALKTLYYSLFHCNLIYCLPIWSSASQTLLSRIFKLQKTAIRIINDASYNEHTEPLFKSSKILPFPALIEFFNLQIMQNFVHNHLPNSFANLWSTSEERRTSDFVLRNGNYLDIPFVRLSTSSNQPLVKLPKTWANFHQEDIKIIADKNLFKTRLKSFFFESMSNTPNCNRLMCPACLRRNLTD